MRCSLTWENKSVSKVKWILVILFLIFLWAGNASAICWVWTSSVNFGNYDVFSPAPTDSAGTISVFCTSVTFLTGTIGPSPNSGGFDPRQMQLTTGPDLMDYNVYRNPARTQIWGDGSGSTYTVSGTVAAWTVVSVSAYGRIPAGQDISAGMYNETLTVTITW